MRILQLSFVVFGGALLAAEPAAAQTSQRFSVQGSGLMAMLFGDIYQGLENGLGFELQARYTPSAFSVGAGYQYTIHGTEEEGFEEEDLSLAGVFVEPRYVIPTQSDKLGPYVSTRFSILRISAEVDGVELSGSGFNANLGGGVLVRVGPRVNLDFGATYGYTNFGDLEVSDSEGQGGTIPGDSGSNLVLRVGVAVGLGG